MNDYAILLSVIGVLTILTNLITEVIKPFTHIKIPTELTATVIAEILTVAAFFAWSDYSSVPIRWYFVVGAMVLGLLVGYAAQFGFDKLQDALKRIKENNNETTI